jgi:hypothetical protein
VDELSPNLTEFDARFGSEKACRDYLFRVRWKDGFRCLRCLGREYWPVRSVLFECANCGHQASLTAGTIFQDTRRPLTDWFRAMFWVTTQKNGANALGLQRVLGLGSYRTAWTWLQKLRRAMVRADFTKSPLSGRIEVDETYVRAVSEHKRAHLTLDRTLIAICAEEAGRGIGQIRIRRIPDATWQSLAPFVEEVVQPGSTYRVHYFRKEATAYDHELWPRVHLVAAKLERWLSSAHQGALTPAHLDYYLAEFTFRFNRRRCANPWKLFHWLVWGAVRIDPAPYGSMVRCRRVRAERKPAG